MILTKMTALGTDGSTVMLWFDDGSKMRLTTDLVARFGLYGGMTLEETDLSALQEAQSRMKARQRAARIVSSARVSERELKNRLRQRGEREEDVDAAVEWLKGMGAVDDRSMAHQLVRREAAKGYGESRIRQSLMAKGIPREYWDEALEDLPDPAEAIDRYLRRNLDPGETDRRAVKKVTDALQRRGHSWQDISSGLRRLEALAESDLEED